MAVTFVRATSYGSAGATTGAIAFSWAAPTRGNLLVAVLSWKSTFTLTTTGWTLIDNPTANADGDGFATYWKVSDGTESSVSFAISGSTDQASGSLIEITGQHPTSPINAHALTNDMVNTATRTAPTVTPTVGYCLAIYGANWNGAGVVTGFSITSSVTMAASGAVEFLCSGTSYEKLGAGTSAVSGRTLTYSTSSGTDAVPGSQAAILIAPAATVSQQQLPVRRSRGLPHPRRGAKPPIITAPARVPQASAHDRPNPPRSRRRLPQTVLPQSTPAVTAQALPPQQAAVRRSLLPHRHARITNFVPAQQTSTTQALPPQQSVRDRPSSWRRRRAAPAGPVLAVVVMAPQGAPRRRFQQVRIRGRVTTQLIPQATVLVPQLVRLARRSPFRVKAHPVNPIPGTPVVTTQALPPQQGVTRRGWLPRRRARGANYVATPAVAASTTQALPPQGVARRRVPMFPRRRATIALPAVSIRALVPVAARKRIVLPARRGHATGAPVMVAVTVPQPSRVRRRVALPVRRAGRVAAVPVRVAVLTVIPQARRARVAAWWRRRRASQVPLEQAFQAEILGDVAIGMPAMPGVSLSVAPTATVTSGASAASVSAVRPGVASVTSRRGAGPDVT